MYKTDSYFTNFVHNNIAIPLIYNYLDWHEIKFDKENTELCDIKKEVDYVFENTNGKQIKIQERFRDKKYKNFNDFTLKYKQEEVNKIDADYLTYGITNIAKENTNQNQDLDFIKFAIINLKNLFEKIENKQIILKTDIKKSVIENKIMYVPILTNVDKSSSFVAFDIKLLNELTNNQEIIIIQKGFY
ncbi:MAG: hypothetical protein JXR51_14950 [Bacteroidales bacterium]|nr:hypothetical protein [Bacteroidales bacterium]MBN2758469.1 hypothetical protein [Bacteroidales bacterium]